MADTGLALRTEGLCYETRDGTRVLRGVDLELAQGQVRFILGNSGSGKSTLLRLLNRLLEPSAGHVTLQDRDAKDWNVRELRRTAVYVPQGSSALGATLRADLSTPLRYAGTHAEDPSLREALDVAQLESMALDRSTEALSAGELARLTLARALLLKPAVLLLDEPTAALDPNTAHALLRALGEWASRHRTALLIVTHRTSELGVLGGRVSLLQDGRIAGEQDALDLVQGRALCPAAAQFLKAERGTA